jgi:3-keto-disaccharide hydrolase
MPDGRPAARVVSRPSSRLAPISERTTPMSRPLVFGLALVLALPAAGRADDWESLFNGKDLTGWKGRADLWSVKDGAITGYTKDGNIPGGNSFLVWDGKLSDFELKVTFKIVGGNSGIQYRSKHVGDPDKFVVAGYQADIDGSKAGGFYGILYEEKGRGVLCNRGTKAWIDEKGTRYEERVADAGEILKAIKPNDWNEYQIIAKANHLTHSINGKTTAEIIDWQNDKRAAEGLLAFQIHAGMGEMTVQFKDIKLKKVTGAEEVTPEKMPISKEAKKIEPPKPAPKKK